MNDKEENGSKFVSRFRGKGGVNLPLRCFPSRAGRA